MAQFFQGENEPNVSIGSPDDLYAKIKRLKDDCDAWVGTWRSNQVKWHKLRMRIKKSKTFPFAGCSNLRMPTIEIKIRKLKAALTNIIFGIRPIVQAIPTPSGNWNTALKIEKFLDHLIMDCMKIKQKVIIAIDKMLEKGFYLLKPHWRVEITTRIEDLTLDDMTLEEAMWFFDVGRTEEELVMALAQRMQADNNPYVWSDNLNEIKRVLAEVLAGKDEVRFTLKDVIYNYPDVALCEPERVYVPTTAGYDPQKASYIIHEFFMPFRDIKRNVKDKGWNGQGVANIELWKGVDLQDKQIDQAKDLREGIERLQSTKELVRIWEFYGWHDINGDGVEEKCVITIAPDFGEVLRKITLPFYSGKFPFVKLFYELTDDRWFSHRGIPEIIEDIVKEIDIQHMQKIDYGTLTNSPMYVFRAGQVNTNTMNFVFGQGIPVSGTNDLKDIIQPLHSQNPNVQFSYEREQMILESKVEELIGQIDFTLQSMINKREPRTLGEVQLQYQNMQQVFSLDADTIKTQIEELFNWIWELWCQYGDDSVEFAYFGKEGWEKIRLSREEVQGKYKITIRGNDQNTNPQIRQQKAQMILGDIYQALQMGIADVGNVINARKRFYQELDIPNWEELVYPTQPKQPPVPNIRLKGDDLTDAEQAQLLAKQGIQPDIQGRHLKKQQEQKEKTVDLVTKAASIMEGE